MVVACLDKRGTKSRWVEKSPEKEAYDGCG